MAEATQVEHLSRGAWTLAHYLVERSPAPMPQIVGLHDHVLDAARVAVTFPIPRTIYVINDAGELQGMIPADRLASTIFDLIDTTDSKPTRGNALYKHALVKEASAITAESLMIPVPVTISDDKDLAEAMRILYYSHLDQVPVLNEKNQIVGVVRALDIIREWVEDTLETQLGDETQSSIHTTFDAATLPRDGHKVSAESLLAKIKESEQARLRIYIGAAAGVGKTYQMLEEAHELKRQDVDVVLGFIEPHGRIETETLVEGLEQVPRKRIEYRGAVFEELDVDAVIGRRPSIVIIDELAHTNVPGSKNEKRYQDVVEILDAGISVITAVNIQHIESLNDAVTRITGVQVRETVPDAFFKRAHEVVDIDVSVDTLRTRLRQGKIYPIEKVQQALNNFFRKGNLSALRELALRRVALDQATKAHDYRQREGLEQAALPEKVMVAMASRGSAKRILRGGARIAGRLATDWVAVYVETPKEQPGRIDPHDYAVLQENIRFAKDLGAKVVKLKGRRVADALIDYARKEGITHVVFGQSARSRWDVLIHGSVINRFLREVRDASVHVVPLENTSALPRTNGPSLTEDKSK
ncbi:MAG TPA: CBS domain-containing protein [Pyrinomonadaceae bacterium]|jgi:two-component system sensor histidine kinase KdpD|nr:CBS domain-containing protein [Pyrinomonadaceae bacterium]